MGGSERHSRGHRRAEPRRQWTHSSSAQEREGTGGDDAGVPAELQGACNASQRDSESRRGAGTCTTCLGHSGQGGEGGGGRGGGIPNPGI